MLLQLAKAAGAGFGYLPLDNEETYGTYQYADPKQDGTYTGEMKGGKPWGRGEIYYADGSVYEGEMKCGKRDGRGTIRYACGAIYVGEWSSGVPDPGRRGDPKAIVCTRTL